MAGWKEQTIPLGCAIPLFNVNDYMAWTKIDFIRDEDNQMKNQFSVSMKDHCVVAINKTSIFMTGGFGQESHAMVIDMKDKRHQAMEPMKQPRRQVGIKRALGFF